jgi:hypothetical protein
MVCDAGWVLADPPRRSLSRGDHLAMRLAVFQLLSSLRDVELMMAARFVWFFALSMIQKKGNK